MGKTKNLCKWEKDERIKHLEDYRKIVKKAVYMCENCGRVATKKKWLCDPYRLTPRKNRSSRAA
jgi:hypothetical protein